MLPVFECGESLFEGRADVTEQVSETVTNRGRLCRTRIKHVVCRPEIKKEGEKKNITEKCIKVKFSYLESRLLRQRRTLLAFNTFSMTIYCNYKQKID